MTDPKKPATEQLRVQSATDQEKGILIDKVFLFGPFVRFFL